MTDIALVINALQVVAVNWVLNNKSISIFYVFISEKGVIFGAQLTEEGIAQIYQLIEYLGKSKLSCFLLFCIKGSFNTRKCFEKINRFTHLLPDL